MHLVIPFAAPLSDAGRQTLRSLRLPHLQALLAGRAVERDEGDAFSLSPPHERALARAWGWSGGDGQLPFAAHQLQLGGTSPGDLAWGLLTPAHWRVGSEHLSLADPAGLQLDEAASRACFDAVAELFTSEGCVLHWQAPLCWLLAHESLTDLATASIDRVIGRNVDRWLPAGPQARLIRRLQNEVQMTLYTHALNGEREARGLPTVNSFWLSGCGVAQPCRGEVALDDRLRSFALAEDWAGWADAWGLIDQSLPARALTRLTLCGERSSLSVALPPRGLLGRLASRWSGVDLAALLETL